MSRIKRGVTAGSRHKKVLRKAKGYFGARSRVYRVAKQAVIKSACILPVNCTEACAVQPGHPHHESSRAPLTDVCVYCSSWSVCDADATDHA